MDLTDVAHPLLSSSREPDGDTAEAICQLVQQPVDLGELPPSSATSSLR